MLRHTCIACLVIIIYTLQLNWKSRLSKNSYCKASLVMQCEKFFVCVSGLETNAVTCEGSESATCCSPRRML